MILKDMPDVLICLIQISSRNLQKFQIYLFIYSIWQSQVTINYTNSD